MGVFDLPAPLFAWLDGLMSGVAPPTLRLVLWGVVGAVLSMALYWALSPQRRIARTKAEAAEARRALDAYDGEFAGAWPLIRRTLRLALKQVGLVAWPAVAASLPVLAMLAWLSTAYGYALPAAGTEVDVRTFPRALPARLVHGADEEEPPPSSAAPPRIVVADESGRVVGSVPLTAPVSTLHKREWWNALFGNPAGYLPDDAPLERIEIDLPQKEYIALGPAWLRSWYVVFFAALLAGSLAIKIAARIE